MKKIEKKRIDLDKSNAHEKELCSGTLIARIFFRENILWTPPVHVRCSEKLQKLRMLAQIWNECTLQWHQASPQSKMTNPTLFLSPFSWFSQEGFSFPPTTPPLARQDFAVAELSEGSEKILVLENKIGKKEKKKINK